MCKVDETSKKHIQKQTEISSSHDKTKKSEWMIEGIGESVKEINKILNKWMNQN